MNRMNMDEELREAKDSPTHKIKSCSYLYILHVTHHIFCGCQSQCNVSAVDRVRQQAC